MKGKYLGAILAGTIVGAAAGMYSSNMMKPRARKRLMKKGMKMLKM